MLEMFSAKTVKLYGCLTMKASADKILSSTESPEKS